MIRPPKPRKPTGLPLVDQLETLAKPSLQDYVSAVSQYVLEEKSLSAGAKKSAQVRLSAGLARTLREDLGCKLARLSRARAGEHKVSGALRIAQADLSEFHQLDGLRLGVEIKPVNLAVGRAIWNRFGDIRTFAVNLHLKFPFAVIGGVLAVPTYEMTPRGSRKPTAHLIGRAVSQLIRAGGRRTEGDAPHLLEAIGVIVYDPDTASIDPGLPAEGQGLRWEEFVERLATAYRSRFDVETTSRSMLPDQDDAVGQCEPRKAPR